MTLPSPARMKSGSRSRRSPPRLARRSRHRAAGFRRDVGEFFGLAGGGAVFQIEPEAELGQHRKLEAHQMHGGLAGVLEIIQRVLEHLIDVLVRIALGQ